MRLAGLVLTAVVLSVYVLVFEDGRPDAWRVAGFSMIGLLIGEIVVGIWDRRQASRER